MALTRWPLPPRLSHARLVTELGARIATAGLPSPVVSPRLPGGYTVDLAWPAARVAVVIEASYGRGLDHVASCQRTTAAALAGYRVLRVTPHQVETGAAVVALVAQALGMPAPDRLQERSET